MNNFVPENVQFNTFTNCRQSNRFDIHIGKQKLEVETYVSTVEVFVTGIKTINRCLIA